MWIPIHVKRLDLGPQEMIGAGCANFRETGRIHAVDKLQHAFRHMHGADKPVCLRDHPAQLRKQLDENFIARLLHPGI